MGQSIENRSRKKLEYEQLVSKVRKSDCRMVGRGWRKSESSLSPGGAGIRNWSSAEYVCLLSTPNSSTKTRTTINSVQLSYKAQTIKILLSLLYQKSRDNNGRRASALDYNHKSRLEPSNNSSSTKCREQSYRTLKPKEIRLPSFYC